MAAAAQTKAQTAEKLARLRANQESEALRRRGAELAAKDRAKQEQWNKVLENHENQARRESQAELPVKLVPSPTKPKILQPVHSLKNDTDLATEYDLQKATEGSCQGGSLNV